MVRMMSPRAGRISVFGSYATGKSYDLFTDLDLLIIMETDKPFLERMKEIYSLLSLPVDADILCYTPEEFEKMKKRGFLKRVLKEEVILYEKGSTGGGEEGKRWLEQAIEDLKWAKELAERGGYHIACFLAQQVGEKALKAFLYAQGEEVVLGRSVERLCSTASHYDAQFSDKVKNWAILDGFYVPTRYPNSLPGSIPAKVYTRNAAMEAVKMAEEIVEFVKGKF